MEQWTTWDHTRRQTSKRSGLSNCVAMHPNPLVCHCGTVLGPLHPPQLGAGGHSAGSITSGKTHYEVHHADIVDSLCLDDGTILQCN